MSKLDQELSNGIGVYVIKLKNYSFTCMQSVPKKHSIASVKLGLLNMI